MTPDRRAARYWAVLAAAGRGARFGAEEPPKQYRPLAGRTVVEHALAPFLALDWIDGVVVVLGAGDRRFSALAVARDPRLRTTTGGATREASVRAGLDAVPPEGDPFVLVHDAARPCVRGADIEALRDAASDEDGGLLAVPVAETVKQARAGRCEGTVDRSALWLAQTPQLFRRSLLQRALKACAEAGATVTDEAAAMERAGHRPRLVRGGADNLKVTTAEDLARAGCVLAARDAA